MTYVCNLFAPLPCYSFLKSPLTPVKYFFRGKQGRVGECYNRRMLTCERCGKSLVGSQVRWCSGRCSKLGLKAAWRKRNAERLKAYGREYRKAKKGGNRTHAYPSMLRSDKCLKCGTDEDLQLAHVKPLWAGGVHKHTITLCRTHHHQFDNLLREFWAA